MCERDVSGAVGMLHLLVKQENLVSSASVSPSQCSGLYVTPMGECRESCHSVLGKV